MQVYFRNIGRRTKVLSFAGERALSADCGCQVLVSAPLTSISVALA